VGECCSQPNSVAVDADYVTTQMTLFNDFSAC